MNNKRQMIQLIFTAVLFLIALIADPANKYVLIALYIAAGLAAGWRVLYKAVLNIKGGRVFDENFLMSIAAIGAFLIGEYPEGVAVLLFYGIGELFENYAVNKSRKSISSLMELRPDHANLMKDGELLEVSPEDVHAGDIIAIKPGERVPLDAVVVEGSSMLDMSALTGESVPREVEAGGVLLSGSINISGLLIAKVTEEYEQSTVSKILDLVENSLARKSWSERFITKFARYYTPVVVGLAALLAVVPPLLVPGQSFESGCRGHSCFL